MSLSSPLRVIIFETKRSGSGLYVGLIHLLLAIALHFVHN
jgi:hypothetical protein